MQLKFVAEISARCTDMPSASKRAESMENATVKFCLGCMKREVIRHCHCHCFAHKVSKVSSGDEVNYEECYLKISGGSTVRLIIVLSNMIC